MQHGGPFVQAQMYLCVQAYASNKNAIHTLIIYEIKKTLAPNHHI